MKFFKIGIITILIFIIALLSAYIIVSSNTSLLKIPINMYLKKYSINSNFKKLKIKSPRSLEVDGFYIKKKGFAFSADVLRLSINNQGLVSVFVKNAVVSVVENTKSSNNNTEFGLPFKISRADIENLKLTVVKNKSVLLKADNIDIHINKNNIKARGDIVYKSKFADLSADINSLEGTFKLSKSAILFQDLKISPKNIEAEVNGAVLKISKDIKIKGLFVTFSPFEVCLVEAMSSLDARVKRFSISSKVKLDVGYSNNFVINAEFSNIVSKSGIAAAKSVKLAIFGKKKLKISYDNVSINYKYVAAQNLCGNLGYSGKYIQSRTTKGEAVFYDRWYINFQNFPLSVDIETKKDYRIKFALRNTVSGNIHFTNKEKVGFDFLISDISKFYDNFIKGAYESDFLNKINLGHKGRVELKGLYYKENKSLSLYAKGVADAASYDNRLFLKHISFSFPVLYGVYGEKEGFLKIDNISFDKKNLSVFSKIYAKKDIIILKNRISKIGRFDIKPFKVSVNLRKKELESAISFVFIDNETKIKGNLKKIVLKQDTIRTKGGIVANAFGGVVYIKNIEVKNIFDMPVLCADIDFRHINLADITKNTNFGLVSGYIEGYIHNLSLVQFKNPLSFNMLVKTQDVKGATQRITLKAINSISKIGGGYVKIAIPFFKSFPYSKIGVAASLQNNRFKMHGLYKDGNKEYIIKKGFLVGVSVINMNKNNSISWDDMIERIKRVLNSKDIEIK